MVRVHLPPPSPSCSTAPIVRVGYIPLSLLAPCPRNTDPLPHIIHFTAVALPTYNKQQPPGPGTRRLAGGRQAEAGGGRGVRVHETARCRHMQRARAAHCGMGKGSPLASLPAGSAGRAVRAAGRRGHVLVRRHQTRQVQPEQIPVRRPSAYVQQVHRDGQAFTARGQGARAGRPASRHHQRPVRTLAHKSKGGRRVRLHRHSMLPAVLRVVCGRVFRRHR